MDVLGSREVDDLCDIKYTKGRSCSNECVDESNQEDSNMSNVEELLEQGRKSESRRKCLAKSASFPSAVPPPTEDDEIVTAMQRMFSEDSVQSTYSRSISLPSSSELVSALKGSREKQGLPPKKLTVKWAPDVYDPPPTSVLHTVGNRKQPKSKNNDKKRKGKKGKKGKNSGQGSGGGGGGGGKDNKQSHKGGGSSVRCYKPPTEFHQDGLTSSSVDRNGFNVGSPDPSFCGSSFLKNSPTTMHYSVAEAL